MRAWIELMRPWNGLMAAVAVAIGFLVAGQTMVFPWQLLFAMVAAFLILGGGMAINDYFDLAIDRRHKKHRPLPSGRIKPEHALAFSAGLFVCGLLLAAQINLACFAIVVLAAVLLILYAVRFSRVLLLGNLVIAVNTSLLILLGAAIVHQTFSALVLVLAALFLFSTLAREIYKSLEDMSADRGFRKTIALAFGRSRTTVVGGIFVLLSIAISPLPFFLGLSLWYLVVVAVANVYFAFIMLQAFKRKYGFVAAHMKYAQFIGLLAFAAGLIK